ncbi:MAG TPA: DNA mismatch repair endonuclease MutL, partial [Spirochaetia bacterium]|nr:DNA mismatch repair endonuclease MutL [Spirochaetia bacterium]
SEEDLRLCYLSHATSKISKEEDLQNLATLGFRGEALSSIASCATLEIVSRSEQTPHACRIVIRDGRLSLFEPTHGKRGTLIEVTNLFSAMPARKQFLKSPSAEAALCRTTLLDKSLPFPSVNFRFLSSGVLKDFFPQQDLRARVAATYSKFLNTSLLHEITCEEEGFSLCMILGGPELARRDRRLLQLFINARRIQNYSLIQAIEYGFSSYLPGGSYPVAFLFLHVDPQFVDFNIHPTKREARLRNLTQIHRRVTACTREFLSRFNISLTSSIGLPKLEAELPDLPQVAEGRERASISASMDVIEGKPSAFSLRAPYVQQEGFRYFGQLFDLFLLVERENDFFVVDQHAAHERILYDRLKSKSQGAQELLFPIAFDVSERERQSIIQAGQILEELGIIVEEVGASTFEIVALPEELLSLAEGELAEMLKSEEGSIEKWIESILITAACRLAVKDGEKIDPSTASELIRSAFHLENARCPHGRPIWYRLSRDELFHLVGRT